MDLIFVDVPSVVTLSVVCSCTLASPYGCCDYDGHGPRASGERQSRALAQYLRRPHSDCSVLEGTVPPPSTSNTETRQVKPFASCQIPRTYSRNERTNERIAHARSLNDEPTRYGGNAPVLPANPRSRSLVCPAVCPVPVSTLTSYPGLLLRCLRSAGLGLS